MAMINICFAGVTGGRRRRSSPPSMPPTTYADLRRVPVGGRAGHGLRDRRRGAGRRARRRPGRLHQRGRGPGQRVDRGRGRGARGHRHQRADRGRLRRARPAGPRPGVGVIAAGNFSVMAAVLRRAAAMAARHLATGRSSTTPATPSPTCPAAPPATSPRPWPGSRAGRAVALAELDGPVEARGAEVAGYQGPLGPAAQLRGQHRGRVRRPGRAADHASRCRADR